MADLVADTNNLLTLFTRLYSNKEVLDKVVVVKADHHTWSVYLAWTVLTTDRELTGQG